jgi:tRNA A37 methylthiotransferase MiaB
LQKAIPEITIATDFIVGFPGETQKDFEESLECMRLLKFPVVNITQYYVRNGTLAAKMT